MIVLDIISQLASKESKYKLSNHEALPTIYSSILRTTRVVLRQHQNEFTGARVLKLSTSFLNNESFMPLK